MSEKTQINILVSEENLRKIDEYAKKELRNRTNFVLFCVFKYIKEAKKSGPSDQLQAPVPE